MTEKRIIVCTKSDKYGKSLVKGLCYIDTGLDIFFEKSLENAMCNFKEGVLITDYEVDDNPRIIKLSKEDKIKPLEQIYGQIRCVFRRNYGIEIYSHRQKTAMIIAIYSKYGGQGVTSFAITLARILSVRSSKKVLYLSLDNIDDSYKYLNLGEKCKSSREEYFFMKEERLATDIENYLLRDQWGVNYYDSGMKENFFGREYARDRILDYIKSEEYFDYIVIDFGKICSVRQQGIQKIIELHSENVYQDLSKESVDNVLKVINFSEYSYGNKQQYYIKKSDKCFTKEAEFVEISMGGEFAQAIEALVDDIDLLGLEWDLDLKFMSE